MAKLIYDYWFVQFEFPHEFKTVKTDEKGRRTELVEVRPYKSSGGKMVWNEELRREVPEGWGVKTIEHYCKSTGGFAFKSNWWTDKGTPIVKIKDIQENNTIDLSDLSFVELTDKKIDDKFRAKPGDVLIAMTGATVGKFGIVPITENPLFVNQRVGFFNLGKEPLDRLPFLINSLNQKYFREAIFTLASGAAQPNISNEQINGIQLLFSEKSLIEEYNLKFKPYYRKILLNQYQNQKLAELRDWLLPMLMNGQVRVGDAAKYEIKGEDLGMVAESSKIYERI
jgi:type I restriction enzyme, S subunit